MKIHASTLSPAALALAALALAALLLAVAPARAQTRTVTLNTGLLNGSSPFSGYLEFSLANGSGPTGDGNSSAAVSNFSLTGGALGAVLPNGMGAPVTGDVKGSLGNVLTLRDDAGGFADIVQAFTVTSNASTLTFNLNLLASTVDSGGFPDDFYFQILDGNQTPLATDGPTQVELVNADYNSLSPLPVGYITQSTTTVGGDTDFPGIKATVTNAPVPEASTTASLGLLLALGLGGLALSARRRKARPVR